MLCLVTFEPRVCVCVRASVYGNSLYYCYVAPTHNCVVFIFMFVFCSLVVFLFSGFSFAVPHPRECAIVLSRPSEIRYDRLELCSNWLHFWMKGDGEGEGEERQCIPFHDTMNNSQLSQSVKTLNWNESLIGLCPFHFDSVVAGADELRCPRTWPVNRSLAGEGSRFPFDTKCQQLWCECHGMSWHGPVWGRDSVKGVMAVIILMSPQNIKTKLKTIKTFPPISMGMGGRRQSQYKNNGNHFEWSKVQL